MGRRSDHSRDELLRMAIEAASKLVAKQGLRGLSTRAIATRMGYSAGTLYQLFDNLDEIILHVNARTLDGFIATCRDVDFTSGPEASLNELAGRYIDYTTKHRNLWSAVFEHSLPGGRMAPPWYGERTRTLLAFGERAIAPLFSEGDTKAIYHEARVLWAGLYGIASLATAGKLPEDESPQSMVQSLIRNYLAGLQIAQSQVQS